MENEAFEPTGFSLIVKPQGGCGHKHCYGGCSKMPAYNWLNEISAINDFPEIIEVRFKNTRKAYFFNSNVMPYEEGEIVAVEASPGHDIGIVCTTGQMVRYKLEMEGIDYKNTEFKKVYRKAKGIDIEKWKEAIALEDNTMIIARKISADLGLNMKIGDVEYQGDKTKAIFYYIAEDRVDFRELIKILADEFRVRIEMKQIGARQEAGRIGGIGSCGRELCCSLWMSTFSTVTTNAARYQEVSLNPQKLAGQCGKLKCCLNFELDTYLDAQEDFPTTTLALETKSGKAIHIKTDVFRRLMWYSMSTDKGPLITCLSVEQVKDIHQMNKKGQYPDKLNGFEESSMTTVIEYQNAAGIESLTRFEDPVSVSKNSRNKKKNRFNPHNRSNN